MEHKLHNHSEIGHHINFLVIIALFILIGISAGFIAGTLVRDVRTCTALGAVLGTVLCLAYTLASKDEKN